MTALEIVGEDWRDAEEGLIKLPHAGAIPDASHSVLIIGYDDNRRLLKIRNSWGANWGDRGNGYISYDYFERYQLETWVIANHTRDGLPRTASGIAWASWGMLDRITGGVLHGFEIFDWTNDECIGWAFVAERDEFADIEELFVRPAYRGKGYGRRLANDIRHSHQIAGRPLRLWGAQPDRMTQTEPATLGTIARLGLSIQETPETWAAYVAT